jgi:hypothetical protein
MNSSTNSSKAQHNSTSNASSGLIVDFPAQSRSTFTVKSVRFANTSELFRFKHPTASENKMKSYTEQDYECFKRVRTVNIIDLSAMLAKKQENGEGMNTEVVCSCIGLEPFLAPDVRRRSQEIKCARALHVATVLEEQKRQSLESDYSEEAIARVSRRTSRTARMRSNRIAAAASSVSV